MSGILRLVDVDIESRGGKAAVVEKGFADYQF
jgi:hypothetical protein